MGTLVTKSQSMATKADYTGNGLFINVNYSEDAMTSTLKTVNGTINKSSEQAPEQLIYAGNFNGELKDGEIQYNMSGVRSSDMPSVIAAIADIETIIKAGEQPVDNGAE